MPYRFPNTHDPVMANLLRFVCGPFGWTRGCFKMDRGGNIIEDLAFHHR
jgi:hypothetical protein